jgi:RHS repeat-associated protein
LNEGRVSHASPKASTYYFHCDVSGLPEELTAASGELAWSAQYKVWGNTVVENWTIKQDGTQALREQPLPQNLRFLGQYLDRESGLHYNTFRYYDPDIGRFISPDPIGLLGGDNLYLYAPNSSRWVDPWGLSYGPVDFAGSPDLFPTSGRQQNIVSIELQGSRSRDFTLAYKEAGFTPAEAAAAKKAGYTWHHVRDYDPVSGRSSMQLVLRTTHEASYPHAGSAEQFAKAHGVAYDTAEAVAYVEDRGRLRGRPTGRLAPGC